MYTSGIGPPEDPFSNLCFLEDTGNRLGLSLADVRLRSKSGCDFAQCLKYEIERDMYEGANPEAIQLYTRPSSDGYITIEPLMCLQSLHLQDEVLEGKDSSRCFVSAGHWEGRLYVYCILIETSGKSLML
jgi:hypothetical protein